MQYKECLTCSHINEPAPGNYCYMFKTAPANLPCGQHDKFRELRKETGRRIIENPQILAQMIREIGRI